MTNSWEMNLEQEKKNLKIDELIDEWKKKLDKHYSSRSSQLFNHIFYKLYLNNHFSINKNCLFLLV
jgi:hypothetical protein